MAKFEVLGKYSRIEGGKRVFYTKGMILEAEPETLRSFMDLMRPLEPLSKPEDKSIPRKLKAVHRGGGKWVVINEITKEVIHEGYLTKVQALQVVEAGGVKVPQSEEEEAPKPTAKKTRQKIE